ncbi:MAG: hypothetical protein ABIG60_03440 [Patescibacteria group bacterium]
MERIKSEQQEKEKKYELPESNIIALDENSVIRKKNKEYYKGLAEEGIEWPAEIQGAGHSDFAKKELKVQYPSGDIFLSYAVTIHELGHLRQGEANSSFPIKLLGSPTPKELKETELHNEIEDDAWQRGMLRAKEYCQEGFEKIDNKFQEYKKQGKYINFNNYEEFIKYISKVSMKITRFNDEFEDNEELSKLEKGGILGRMIKKDPLTNEFFTQQEKWRTGEKVNQAEIENFIRKMSERIAEEKY